jgi:hypothetical protein
VTAGTLLGVGVGLGLLLVVVGLWPARAPLGLVLAPLRTRPTATGSAGAAPALPPWRADLGRSVASAFRVIGVGVPQLHADLAITGRSMEWLLSEKLLDALVAVLGVPGLVALAGAFGLRLPWLLPVWVAVGFAAAAFFTPDAKLKLAAAAKRRTMQHATSAYLDLVAISLAGGAAAEEALRNALADGQGWAFDRLRGAIDDAQLQGVPPWQALGRLGRELDIRELVELADSLALAGTEGATVRKTLIAKAVTSRAHQLADAEVRALTATDRMVLPLLVLLFGFIIFVLYPALVRAIAGF